MGWLDKTPEDIRQARRELRQQHRQSARDEAHRQRMEQARAEEERLRLEREERDRLHHYDMRDGRFDGRPN